MPINDKQKVDLLDINANSLQLIRDKLALGWVILFIVDLQPLFSKLLIVYATPELI